MEKSVSTVKMRRTEVDRISDLPDSLLIHILSFLPTKEAIATSLLSKRWTPLWLSLHTLDYNRKKFQRLPLFHRFVDKVFKLVDLKYVKKFVLTCDHIENRENFRPFKISKWINTVIYSSKVEHLELNLMRWFAYELPSSIVLANNIRVLKLSRVTVGPTLSHVNLPLLEVLHLNYVKFPDFRCLEMLLSACILLKDLVVRFSDVVDYHLKIARFDHLVSADIPQSLLPLEIISNVKCLRLRKCSKQDMWPFCDVIPMFYNVIRLECVAEEWTKMVNCLINFPKLQKLVIYGVGSSSSSPPEPILDVPPCVSLHLRDFTICSFGGSAYEFEIIKFMMTNAKVLRAIFVRALVSSREYGLLKFLDLEAWLRSGYERCSRMQPALLFMFFDT